MRKSRGDSEMSRARGWERSGRETDMGAVNERKMEIALQSEGYKERGQAWRRARQRERKRERERDAKKEGERQGDSKGYERGRE